MRRIFDNPHNLRQWAIDARLRVLDSAAEAYPYSATSEEGKVTHYVGIVSTLPDADVRAVLKDAPTKAEGASRHALEETAALNSRTQALEQATSDNAEKGMAKRLDDIKARLSKLET